MHLEALEERSLLSYLVVPHGNTVVPVHVSDARANEPLFSNGLAVKKAPHFYNLYTGPKRPELNGIRATGFVNGDDLVLSGTVAGPIPQPATPAQSALYVFVIDRGGSSRQGPYPGRPHIRYDTVVTVQVLPAGTVAYLRRYDPLTHIPEKTVEPVPGVTVSGSLVTVKVPLSMLPSTGHAIDQWNVNFIARNPAQRQNFHSIASFTPEFTEFQVSMKPQTSQP